MPEQETVTRLTPIDINDDNAPDGGLLEINPDFDAYDIPAPPPAGKYALKLYLGRDGYQQGEQNGSVYYVVPLELKIAEGPYAGRTVFARVDTRLWPGKENHTLGTLLAKRLGSSKVPKRATAKEWVLFFDKFRQKEPVVWAYIDWQAYSRATDSVVVTGMNNFPKTPSGNPNHIVKDKLGNPCYARAQVVRWLSQDEFRKSDEIIAMPVVEEEELAF
jgi:hypothetical protein